MEQHKRQETERRGAEAEEETSVFTAYYKPLAERTRKRQWRELASLRVFLLELGILVGNLATDVLSWSKITHELLWSYVLHLKEHHYTASSITMQLHTIKTYARLAMGDGKVSENEYEKRHKLQAPPDTEGEPRRGEKRGTYLDLTDEQVWQLLNQPDTPRGRSDRLLLALLLLCGFWPREIAALDRHSLDLQAGTITFYHYHTEEQRTLHVDPVTLEAAKHYLQDPSPYEALFVGNHKESTHTLRLTDRAINARTRTLGEQIGVNVLAPQDCHAYWAKSSQKEKQLLRPGLFDFSITDEAHRSSSPGRKQRPDIFNRRSFEESMRRSGEVEDSMIAPFVSNIRLLLPWAIEFLSQQEDLKQAFLQYMQQQAPKYELKQVDVSKAFDHVERWMKDELEQYRASRSE